MTSDAVWQHWQLRHDPDGIAWLTLDCAGDGPNTLGRAVLEEFGQVLDALDAAPPRGLVLRSGKPAGFAAGADLREFDGYRDADEVASLIRHVHGLFARLEAAPWPVACVIHGHCLGGGLELALACHWRVAHDLPSTRLGFPEVRLGIYPGFGGTLRATRRLGGPAALGLMLTSRTLAARAARAAGLVDAVAGTHESPDWLARRAVLAGRRSRPGWFAQLSNSAAARAVIAPLIRRQTAQKVRADHYPAPFRLIEHWRLDGGDAARMLEGEAREVAGLLTGEVSRNLRRVYFATEQLKSLGRQNAAPVAHRLHVEGAGVMGGDIAAVAALAGLEVTLHDLDAARIDAALARARGLFARRLKTPAERLAAAGRLIADPAGDGVARADVLIEAVIEDAGVKRTLFAALEARLPAHALLATNTSALPLETLASALDDPGRLIGLHFFNPVPRMPLVEVVHGEASTPAAVARGCALAVQLGKYPLPCRSQPGFLVNRVLAPYLLAALRLLLAGTPAATLDAAAVGFGMPVGPIELADTVGLDVCRHVLVTLGPAEPAAAAALDARIAAGRLGRKSGQGFYAWKDGKVRRPAAATGTPAELAALADAMLAPLLDACERALADGVVASAEQLDAGVILGTGFAPFRGGPLRYRGLA